MVGEAPGTASDPTLADAIWADALRVRPTLFDGRVFVADRVTTGCIDGHWTAYRQLYAQLRHPDRFALPHLRALAVNGLLLCPDGIVFGRRCADAVYRPGCWQTVPAGSVEARAGNDAVHIGVQILAELREEIGIDADAVGPVLPLLAMEHPGGRVLDIGCAVRTALSFAEIRRRWREHGDGEYDGLRVVPVTDVPHLLRESGPDLLGSARLLLGFYLDRSEQIHDRLAERG